MHVDVELVRLLVREQFSRYADLPVSPVSSSGCDHALFRLGDELYVRLPRADWAIGQLDKEWEWLSRLAPKLPLAIPTPVEMGEPDYGYPCSWAIYQWIEGENPVEDSIDLATDLASFLATLHELDATGAPPPGDHNFHRGVPLARNDEEVRDCIAKLEGKIDYHAAMRLWEDALRAPVYGEAPVWIHGDPQRGNLLVRDGTLTAVIDFGGLGAGDPACDLIVAWNFLSTEPRAAFREVLSPNDATWLRGMGWALSCGVIGLEYYETRNEAAAAMARRTISEVLAAH